jgi:hypothetical protein
LRGNSLIEGDVSTFDQGPGRDGHGRPMCSDARALTVLLLVRTATAMAYLRARLVERPKTSMNSVSSMLG